MHRSYSQTGGWNILLSALWGGEGRGEVGEPPVSNSRATHLTLPAQPRRAPPSPPERAERSFSAGFCR
jgi:hypothetical protein